MGAPHERALNLGTMDRTRWALISQLFHAAAQRDAAERDAFLEEACGDDRALYDEVQALLRQDARASGWLREAVSDAAGAATAEWLEGRSVGPYRLLRELGRGGMGAVYLAERVDGQFEQQVALKLVKRGMDSEQILARFRMERQILARLQHPNIARLLDGGVADDGQPYFAMEYVEGEPIDEYCDRHRLPVERRLALFQEACRAVVSAHANLVIHRDLKPDNILVTADGHVRLLDFGIAKLVAPDDDAVQTQTGLKMMTPAYASPEQVRGEAVGTATDVYSLGMVLYELLAGVKPYELTGRSAAEVERAVSHTEPERPSARVKQDAENGMDARRLRRRLAGDLDVICLKALKKDPERRYGSVEALLEDIRRHLAGLPVVARPDTLGYRVRKFTARHRVGVATAAAVVVVIAALVTFYTLRLTEERDRAQVEAAKANEVAEFLQGLFEVSGPGESLGETVTARDLLDRGAERIESDLHGQPEVQATMMRVIGEVYGRLGSYQQARELVEQALERHLATYGDEHEEVATARAAYGVVLQNMGDWAGAEDQLRQALAMRRRIFGREHPEVASSTMNLAFAVERTGNLVEAEELYREALAQYRTFLTADHPSIALALVRLGTLLRLTDRLDDAEPVLREALGALRGAYGDVHPRVASAMRNLAALHRDKGDYVGADTLYSEVIALRRQVLGDDHPDVASALHSYGLLLRRMGERDRALAVFTESMEIHEAAHEVHPNLSIGYYDIGIELRDRGRYEEAADWMQRAVRMDDLARAPDHPHRAYPWSGLASVYTAQGRHVEAEPWLRRALAHRRQTLAPEHGDVLASVRALGANLAAQGRAAEADSILAEAGTVP